MAQSAMRKTLTVSKGSELAYKQVDRAHYLQGVRGRGEAMQQYTPSTRRVHTRQLPPWQTMLFPAIKLFKLSNVIYADMYYQMLQMACIDAEVVMQLL